MRFYGLTENKRVVYLHSFLNHVTMLPVYILVFASLTKILGVGKIY